MSKLLEPPSNPKVSDKARETATAKCWAVGLPHEPSALDCDLDGGDNPSRALVSAGFAIKDSACPHKAQADKVAAGKCADLGTLRKKPGNCGTGCGGTGWKMGRAPQIQWPSAGAAMRSPPMH